MINLSKNILVIGDLMLDEYLYGTVERISPEAPVPILNVKETLYTLGGASNVALCLSNLGANVFLAGYVGDDTQGELMLNLLKDKKINTKNVYKHKNTIVKTRLINNNQQLYRFDRENKLSEFCIEQEMFNNIDCVIISDYAKGTITPDNIKKIQQFCTQRNIFLAADLKPINAFNINNIDLFKPNRHEALQILKEKTYVDDEEVAKDLYLKYKPKYLVLTLGSKGMIGMFQNELIYIEALSANAINVTGAGDVVLAVVVYSMLKNVSFKESLYNASNMVARSIQTKSTCVVM